MGKVRDLKRKQQRLRLLEKRLKAQGQPRAVVANEREINERITAARLEARDYGRLEALERALAISKETKTVATIRRKLGDQVRRLRAKSGALTTMDLGA